ncbi:hypothetical protein FIBSPDRAFT_169190 [Athelia psychrophila]|uniref:Uncharacterized protein n=1 Tax=Athelia psychrophila TaxID=1759441 RepID=A0A166B008_9AGAM|nr:hypothetical protein FIBSPDRAFT_169190 [Fibularhizoctonia sp. CBS 109695]
MRRIRRAYTYLQYRKIKHTNDVCDYRVGAGILRTECGNKYIRGSDEGGPHVSPLEADI